jgi:hypothetical protein
MYDEDSGYQAPGFGGHFDARAIATRRTMRDIIMIAPLEKY